MISLIAAVLVFGTIVLIHEFGHFIVAKRCGIGVIEFSIGMGPRILSFEKGGTRYSIKCLPFGGSCMMNGEDENASDETSFNSKSVWARMAVIAAGPIFNFILAFLLSLIIVSYAGYDSPEIAGIIDGYPAQEAGLREGDVITKFNNKSIVIYRDIQLYIALKPSDSIQVSYRRPGVEGVQTTTLTPRYSADSGTYLMGIRGIGVKPADTIGKKLKYSAYEVKYWIDYAIKSIGMIFSGSVKADEISGPVKIVSMIGDTVEENKQYGVTSVLLNLVNMCILLSANLGVMNLLPIPALDGGRLVFLILEVLRGKPIDKEKEGMVHLGGMVLLMALMVIVLFNDIRSFF